MQWRDRGFVIQARRLLGRGAVVRVLTTKHGMHSGYWRGSRLPLSGSIVDVQWRGRLGEHMGAWRMEDIVAPDYQVMNDPARLAAMMTAITMIAAQSSDCEPVPDVFASFLQLWLSLSHPCWWGAYGRWELSMLSLAGYGLSMDCCALTGKTGHELVRISPRTGRAICHEALGLPSVQDIRGRLLPLPAYWHNLNTEQEEDACSAVSVHEVVDGLKTTGHFLSRWLFSGTMPAERQIVIDSLNQQCNESPRQP